MVLECTYVNGKKHGIQIEYKFHPFKIVSNYENGILHGPYQEFQRAGFCSLDVTYINGVLDGPFKQLKYIDTIALKYTEAY